MKKGQVNIIVGMVAELSATVTEDKKAELFTITSAPGYRTRGYRQRLKRSSTQAFPTDAGQKRINLLAKENSLFEPHPVCPV